MYSDTPIFQTLLEERRGRWPGIPMEELPPVTLSVPEEDLSTPSRAMYRVVPMQEAPGRSVRPYMDAEPLSDPDPEATAPMPLPDPVPEPVEG
jgi:hypothetical protein